MPARPEVAKYVAELQGSARSDDLLSPNQAVPRQGLNRRRFSLIADSCGRNLDRDMNRSRQPIPVDVSNTPQLRAGIGEW